MEANLCRICLFVCLYICIDIGDPVIKSHIFVHVPSQDLDFQRHMSWSLFF